MRERRFPGRPRFERLASSFAFRLSVERLEERCLLAAMTVAGDYESDSVLVRFQPGFDLPAIVQNLFGGTELGRSFAALVPGLKEVRLPAGASVDAALAALRSSPFVQYAEPNYKLQIDETIPSDSSFSSLYGLKNAGQSGGTLDADIDATDAWDITTGSSSIIVAVIDSGIDYNHPDLAANIWTNPDEIADGLDNDGNGYIDDIRGWDFRNNDNNPQDDNSHGTHVAGTIGAVGNNGIGVAGVNWNVKLMPLKFISSSGSGDMADAIEALQYALAKGAQVSNHSYGTSTFSQAYLDALNLAMAGNRHLAVMAAGNGNYFGSPVNIDSRPFYPASYQPTLDNTIVVAATDRNDKFASFSNYGPLRVDLAAPGVDTYSTMPTNQGSYGTKSGTSMATPHVAGAAALVWAADVNLTAAQIKSLLLNSVDPIGALNPTRPTLTNGRLNVHKALLAMQPALPLDDLPTVSLDSSPLTAGTLAGVVTLTATAADNGSVAKVEFFAGANKIGEDTDSDGGWSVQWDTSPLYNGPFTLTARAFDNLGQSATSDPVSVTVDNPAGPPTLYFSLSTDGTLGGLSFANEDILSTDGKYFHKFFDGSDVGLASLVLDAFAFLSPTEIVMSFTNAATIGGIAVDDSDLVKFTATSLGEETAGAWSMYFDGSDVGLTTNSEDIDILALLPDGSLLISLLGSFGVSGASGSGEDVLRFVPTSLGSTTAGKWSVYFDGSDVSLSGTAENLDALAVDAAGKLYLSTSGNFSVTGRSGANEDLFVFTPTQTGTTTRGTYSPNLFFDGSLLGLDANNLADIELPPAAATTTTAASTQQLQALDLLFYDLGLPSQKSKTRR